jgi:hypothetical protein
MNSEIYMDEVIVKKKKKFIFEKSFFEPRSCKATQKKATMAQRIL